MANNAADVNIVSYVDILLRALANIDLLAQGDVTIHANSGLDAASGTITFKINGTSVLTLSSSGTTITSAAALRVERASVFSGVLVGLVTGDTQSRIEIGANGKILWSAGTGNLDLTMARGAAGVLSIEDGTVATAVSATAPAITNDTTIDTTAVGVARVNPGGNVTGIILEAGTLTGQEITVINESAFTVTFAAAGTSNVADGTSAVIAALRAQKYIWNGATSRWYRTG